MWTCTFSICWISSQTVIRLLTRAKNIAALAREKIAILKLISYVFLVWVVIWLLSLVVGVCIRLLLVIFY